MYNKNILFIKEIFLKGVILMTYADFIWKLIEILLEEKKQEEKTVDNPKESCKRLVHN